MICFNFRVFALVGIFLGYTSIASSPEKVLPKMKAIHPAEWYSEQAMAWASVIEKEPGNTEAWLNLYTASRYALPAETSASTDNRHNRALNELVDRMEKAIPNTFVDHYVHFWHSGNVTHLQKAYELEPDNPLTYDDFIVLHELNRRIEQKAEFCRKWLNSRDLAPGLLNYGYNVLMSVEPNGLLVTMGDNATLPVWVVQGAMNIRPDVIVLNLDLLTNPPYRQQLLLENQLQLPDESAISAEADPEAWKRHICRQLPVQNPSRNFYFALTIPKEKLSDIRSQLYVVGLVSQLSDQRVDNLAIMKKNWEQNFLTDYLTVDFNGESEFSTVKILNTNYLVPVLMLQEHYQGSGEQEKAEKMEQLALRIAEESGKKTAVKNYLNRDATILMDNPISPGANEKNLKPKLVYGFVPLFSHVYARDVEITNREYNTFLEYLKATKLTEQYERCKIDLSAYQGLEGAMLKAYHQPEFAGKYTPKNLKKSRQITQQSIQTMDSLPVPPQKFPKAFKNRNSQHRSTTYEDYPVLRLSYEAANLYCNWLTDNYNKNPERQFSKVKFRLPTLNEWRIAALGSNTFAKGKPIFEEAVLVKHAKGKPEQRVDSKAIKYPWWMADQKPFNHYGCYLSNFKVEGPCDCPVQPQAGDGFVFTGPVASYFANDLGLYDVVGNVAEMIDEKGKACGGSWDHTPEESTITSVMQYTGPDLRVGFRVFMEVLEEKK